ncbi:MAG TPA: helix-turn-helix domain-containing protein [Stellaceae bacterium]|nr:helix-turn-helix domain-containing protein [Stellaceae bacterium]
MAASPLPRLRLDSEARRRRIVDAALPLFARKGFAGTTTKEIAEAAEVSEALLFKHFPTKAALYGAIQDFGCRIKEEALERLRTLEPSTAGLVLMAYMMVHHIVRGDVDDRLSGDTRHRLVANSLLADGDYARLLYETIFSQVFPKFGACLEAAEAAGDLAAMPVKHRNRFWFGQHVAATVALVSLPGKPAVPYQGDQDQIIREAVWFILRGLGLKDAAIAAHYDAEKLVEYARSFAQPSGETPQAGESRSNGIGRSSS